MLQKPKRKLIATLGAGVAALGAAFAIYTWLPARDSAPMVSSTECSTPTDVACLAALAVRLTPRVTNQYVLSNVSEDLARSGNFAKADQVASHIAAPDMRGFAERTIAIFKAEAAISANKSDSEIIAPIEQLATTGNSKDVPLANVSGAYYLLGLELLGQHPFSNGGNSDVTFAERKKYAHSIPSHSHPVALVTSRLAAIVPKLPAPYQGSAWTNLADLLIKTGDITGAADALKKASQSNALLGLVARRWLTLGNYSEALKIIEAEKNSYLAADDYAALAEAEVTNGISGTAAHDLLREAIQAAEVRLHGTPDFELVRREISLELKANQQTDAKVEAEDMLGSARAPAPFKAMNLANVAAMYIDIGQAEKAKQILQEATESLPGNNRTVLGYGAVSGVVTCSTFHSCDRMRAAIAAQDYRLGDMADFDQLVNQIGPDYRFWASRTILQENVPGRLPAAIITRLDRDLPKRDQLLLFIELAGLELSRGNTTLSLSILEGLPISEIGNTLTDFTSLQTAARMSFLLDRPDLVRKQFIAMVAVADAMTDVAEKARAYAAAAAFRREFPVD